MKSSIRKVSDTPRFTGKLLQIVDRKFAIDKDNEERSFTIEVARRPPGVRLIITDGKKLLLGREFRSELESWDYRLVGGKIFESLELFIEFLDGKEEIYASAENAVRAEGLEEAGIIVKNQEHFYKSTSGATIEWDLHYYVVRDYKIAASGNETEQNEIIEPVWVSYDKAIDMCIDGSIQEDRSLGVLMKFLLTEGAMKKSITQL